MSTLSDFTVPKRLGRHSAMRRYEADAQGMRELMSRFPTGVSVVTTVDQNGSPQGMTCSSLASVCLSPPILLACMRTDSRTCSAVQQRRHFAVNLLNEDASEVAKLFSSYDADRFGRVEWGYSPTGLPWLMRYASGVADCMVAKEAEVGDHTVVFGRLQRLRVGNGRPLMYGMRRFFMSAHASAELASGAEGWPSYVDEHGVRLS